MRGFAAMPFLSLARVARIALVSLVLILPGIAWAYPPVYLTVVSHNEEPGGSRPDYMADPNYYLQNRDLLKLLVETVTSRGATYNFQSDWNYLKAVALYDTGGVTGNTNGKNIVRWMREDLGVQVDPHAHETQYNYADVAYLIEQLGVTPSRNVGGFLYDPADNPQGWEQHENGIYGRVYPSYFWRADLLWGAATFQHQGSDDSSSGIWRPRDRYNFHVDDPNQRLLYIGGGCGGQVELLKLLDDIASERVPADGFYTANLMMIQDWMTPQSIAQLGAFIDSLAPYVAQGRVRWSTLSQTAEVWRTQHGSMPFRYDCAAAASTPLYVVPMTHVEGDAGMPVGSPQCPTSLFYQTLPLPPVGQTPPGPTFSVDIRGTEMLREVFQNHHDSYGAEPRLFIEPAGEFWQTEASPAYGGKLFQTYDYQALGYELGIQGHAIYYSGTNFCWYNSPHTAEGIQRKLADLHLAAQTVLRNGQPVNGGRTFTGGWKLEKDALGAANAEYIIDHAAADLGYRISFEDHDGHIEDEPAGIDNSRASHYVYRADYGDGVQMVKIDFNGSVRANCAGNTPRCETPAEAIARLDNTLAARDADSDPNHVYYLAFTVHSGGVWDDFNRAAVGQPMVGEGAGLLALMDAIEARKNAGTSIRYITPGGLADVFEAANPPAGTYTIEAIETWVSAPNGSQIYARIVQPVPGLYPGRRFPALIAIPGGTGAGAPLADSPGYRGLAASGFVVVVFNPEGRGAGTPGNLRSQGVENCNGFVHQDDLKAIVEHTAAMPNVEARNIGVETSSFGIAIGSGALGRYPDLPVAYLVDQEGPHDSRVITFYDVGHETAVCGHWSTVTDPSPANQAFWAEREAVRHIGGFPGMYLRMQAEIDHAQGVGYFRHTIEMLDAATRPAQGGTGTARWTRANGADIGNPIDVAYALDEPTRYPAWVTGRLADHPGLNLAYDREMSSLVGAGDFDGDDDVDADDATRFETCFTGAGGGPIAAGCGAGDFDLDGEIDCVDWGQFALVWTQPGGPPVFSECAAVPGAVAGLRLSAAGASLENLRLEWDPVSSAVRYAIYVDTSPDGLFTTELATGIGRTWIEVPMPPETILYLKVSGVNLDGMEGPR